MNLYSDGGVCGSNPSKIGGTWAWIAVSRDDAEIARGSGPVIPRYLGTPAVSNNQTELLAAVIALEFAPAGHHVTLFTDSLITLRRIERPTEGKFAGIPEFLRDRTIAAVQRLGEVKVILVGGHPTGQEMEQGFKDKNRLPVSKWNVECDKMCNEAKKMLA